MFVSPTWKPPFIRTAQTPTVAQSWARRVNFSYAHPPLVLGTRISVSTSCGSSAVWRKPAKLSAIGRRRSPPGPRTTSSASSASRIVGASEAGSVCATEPPIVPRCLTCGSPIVPTDSARIGHPDLRSSSCCEVVIARERADRDRVAVLAHVREVGEPADVHQQLGTSEPEPHERQQRVPAREELRVGAGAEELDRVVDGLGDLVVEGCGDHFAPPSCSARQTFSGLAGIVTSVTP